MSHLDLLENSRQGSNILFIQPSINGLTTSLKSHDRRETQNSNRFQELPEKSIGDRAPWLGLANDLNAGVPLVSPIFPEAAVAAPQGGETVDDLDVHDVLGLLVAQLPLDSETQRCAMAHR